VPDNDALITGVKNAELPAGTADDDNNADGTIVGTTENNEDTEDIEDNETDIEQTMNAKYGARQSKHNLRPQHPRDYSHIHVNLEGITMTQHSMKKGIKLFGQAGVDAVSKELQQLHYQKSDGTEESRSDISCG
jgi:hypothetical protein